MSVFFLALHVKCILELPKLGFREVSQFEWTTAGYISWFCTHNCLVVLLTTSDVHNIIAGTDIFWGLAHNVPGFAGKNLTNIQDPYRIPSSDLHTLYLRSPHSWILIKCIKELPEATKTLHSFKGLEISELCLKEKNTLIQPMLKVKVISLKLNKMFKFLLSLLVICLLTAPLGFAG